MDHTLMKVSSRPWKRTLGRCGGRCAASIHSAKLLKPLILGFGSMGWKAAAESMMTSAHMAMTSRAFAPEVVNSVHERWSGCSVRFRSSFHTWRKVSS